MSEKTVPSQGPFAEAVLGIRPLSDYALVIDARTPGEYLDDHLPGAVNLPVVDQEQI